MQGGLIKKAFFLLPVQTRGHISRQLDDPGLPGLFIHRKDIEVITAQGSYDGQLLLQLPFGTFRCVDDLLVPSVPQDERQDHPHPQR